VNNTSKQFREATEWVNEMCVALKILTGSSQGVKQLDYEPCLPGTPKTIDFCSIATDGKVTWWDVKTVHPEAMDDWDKYVEHKRRKWLDGLILDKNGLGGEFYHKYYASRGKFLDYTLELEKKIHTPAHTYRTVLDLVQEIKPEFKLLGLTATPTRMIDNERAILYQYYNSKEIHKVTLTELITSKILAKPDYKVLRTNLNFEKKFKPEDIKHIERFGELPENVLDEIGLDAERNLCIVKEYLENRPKHGKTLAFAINQQHSITLCDEFRKEGVLVDYVISSRGSIVNDKITQRFIRGEIEVFINIDIVGEGTDVTDIQTVFLTGPTKSETRKGKPLEEALNLSIVELLKYKRYRETLEYLELAKELATSPIDVEKGIKRIGGGWVGEEALAISVYCSLKFNDDWTGGTLASVNHSGDSDSTGSITGAILGALLGVEAIPEQWRRLVENADVIEKVASDMWKIFGEDQ